MPGCVQAADAWSCEFAAGAARHDRTPQLRAEKSIGTKIQCVSIRWRIVFGLETIEEEMNGAPLSDVIAPSGAGWRNPSALSRVVEVAIGHDRKVDEKSMRRTDASKVGLVDDHDRPHARRRIDRA